MLAFLRDLYEGDEEQALCSYYRSGSSIAAVLRQLLRWRFGEPRKTPSMLDFASGYGRVTRFLLDEVPPEAITVADVLPGALSFQRQTLGVHAVPSSVRPEELALPGGFAAIFVTSLFTHLPEARFGAWLAALMARLEPGGVFAFSTHDLALLPSEQRPSSGICFQPHSEIAQLSTADYGSTWVDEAFVRAALGATGLPLAAVRFERALCNYQDLWVVVPEPLETFAGLRLQGEVEVVVEKLEMTSRELALRGWAHARHGGVSRLEVVLDGILLGTVPVTLPRADVAAWVGPEAGHSGWELHAELPPSRSPAQSVLLFRAFDPKGDGQVAWVGRVQSANLQVRAAQVRWLLGEVHRVKGELDAQRAEAAAEQARAAHEMATLRARMGGMEASRFWKLRNGWFRLKRALRLTDEM